MVEEAAQLLARLVRARGVNPMGGDASRAGYNEEAPGAIVKEFLGSIGLAPEVQEVAPHRANVWAVTPGASDAPPVLFTAHLDTVPAETWTGDAWDPVVRDGFLHGRGSCDTKASLTAMLIALREFVERGAGPRPILFLATCDEESGHEGARAWAALGRRAMFGVVGEPTNLDIIRAHKGISRWDLRTTGVSAHSSSRDRGVCAITRMARVVLCLERFYQDTLRHRRHPLLGCATLSVGVIQGGQNVNTVASRCEVQVDRRLLPGETPASAWEEITQVLRQDPAIDFDVECVHKRMELPGLDTPMDSPPVAAAQAACRRVLGVAPVSGVAYGTDGAILAQAGTPCVILGPGDIACAHTDHERVELAQVEKAVAVYLEIMLEAQRL